MTNKGRETQVYNLKYRTLDWLCCTAPLSSPVTFNPELIWPKKRWSSLHIVTERLPNHIRLSHAVEWYLVIACCRQVKQKKIYGKKERDPDTRTHTFVTLNTFNDSAVADWERGRKPFLEWRIGKIRISTESKMNMKQKLRAKNNLVLYQWLSDTIDKVTENCHIDATPTCFITWLLISEAPQPQHRSNKSPQCNSEWFIAINGYTIRDYSWANVRSRDTYSCRGNQHRLWPKNPQSVSPQLFIIILEHFCIH